MSNINNKNLISFTFVSLTIFIYALFLMTNVASAYNCSNSYSNNDGPYYNLCGNYNSGTNNNSYNNGNYNNNNINPVPSISVLSPNSAQINSNTTITVSGYGFIPSSIIKLNNSNRATTFINSSTLKTQLYYSDLSTKGEFLITVFNPAPGGGYSNATTFTVNNIVPVVNNINNTTKNTNSSVTKNINTTTAKNVTSTDTNNKTTNDNVSQGKDLAAGAIFGSNAFMPSSLLQWFFFAILILLAVILWRKLYVSDADKATHLKHA